MLAQLLERRLPGAARARETRAPAAPLDRECCELGEAQDLEARDLVPALPDAGSGERASQGLERVLLAHRVREPASAARQPRAARELEPQGALRPHQRREPQGERRQPGAAGALLELPQRAQARRARVGMGADSAQDQEAHLAPPAPFRREPLERRGREPLAAHDRGRPGARSGALGAGETAALE